MTTVSLKGARVFLTGLSGFIGSHLGRRLVNEGSRVFALVRRNSDLWRVKDLKRDIIIVTGDLMDADAVRRALREIRPTIVFHLASRVDMSRSFDLLEDMVGINITGTLNIIRGLKNQDVTCFITAGASEEYGDADVPFREDQLPCPASPYSATKASVTMICRMLNTGLSLPMVTLRPSPTYGPFQTNDMLIPHCIARALRGETIRMTKGDQGRDFVHVADVVEGFVRAAQIQEALGEVINLGSGREYSLKDVVDMIVTMTKSLSRVEREALPYRKGEAMHFLSDTSKARRLLGWVPKIELEDGLRETISWYRKYLAEERVRKEGAHGR